MDDLKITEPPLPRHLREIATNYRWEGRWPRFDTWFDIRCQCGCLRFNAIYVGSPHQGSGGDLFMNPARIGVRCLDCSAEHLIFDKQLHGWDGFVTTSAAEPAPPRKPFDNQWVCECSSEEFLMHAAITHEANDLAEGGDYTTIDNWFEAFDQFGVDVTCLKCNKRSYIAGYES